MSYRFRIRISLLPLFAAVLAVAAVFVPGSDPAGDEAGASGDNYKGEHTGTPAAVAVLTDVEGNRVGRVYFAPAPQQEGTWVRIVGRNLTPGWQTFSLHETGECDPNAEDAGGFEAPFSTAGDRWDPTAAPTGSRAGDLPELLVTDDGKAWSRFVTDRFEVGQLFEDEGASVVIESEALGIRTACGVVRRAGS